MDGDLSCDQGFIWLSTRLGQRLRQAWQVSPQSQSYARGLRVGTGYSSLPQLVVWKSSCSKKGFASEYTTCRSYVSRRSSKFLGISIYTSLFWLVGGFSRTSFSLPVGANQACIGREKKLRFSLFQATWILGNLNCWITPLVCTNQRCIEEFFCPNNTLPVRANHVLETFFCI